MVFSALRFLWMASPLIYEFGDIQLKQGNLKDTLDQVRSLSPYLKDLWWAVVLNLAHLIWLTRINLIFEGKLASSQVIMANLLSAAKDVALSSVDHMHNSVSDLTIIANLGVQTRARQTPILQKCRWILPWYEEIMLNCDCSALGNPGKVDLGIVARDHAGNFLGVITKVPWQFKVKWNIIKPFFTSLRFSAIWREGNFSADKASKKGNSLPNGCKTVYSGKLDLITD
ncbi:hypothetical protein GIB67_013261 [Kingdonia uniflora]|uniref:RNase H type-1 domain-containing protein n=1 Tax=Kingdonia uniflora TaxID=39325 RepID=A0A7J7N687_9MAGN|nr:hypothetical protein GIB67_013261 [Kingdonia uniflora]